MEPSPPAALVVPNPRIPKVLGILNIVFSSGLLICGLCTFGYYASIPVMSKAVNRIQEEAQAKEDAGTAAELKRLAEEEEAAETDAEKAAVREERKQVENRPKVFLGGQMDLKAAGFNNQAWKRYVVVEFATGLTLNLLLLASGIGLVQMRRWGLVLGLWVAALKLLRLVLLYGYLATVLAPHFSQTLAKAQMQLIVQQQVAMGKPLPPNLSVHELGRVYVMVFTSLAVAIIAIGSIYPIISLWLLSRPAARAACSTAAKPPGTDDTW